MNIFSSARYSRRSSSIVAVCVVAAVVASGLLFVVLSRASGMSISLQPEAGSLAGTATKTSDTAASEGAAVRFGSGVLLSETFTGPDGVFVSSSDFWSSSDLGASKNAVWMSESGEMYRRSNAGTANDSMFRMWTRRNDLGNVKMEMDIRYQGFFSGSNGWDGINMWLNESFCTPEGDGSCTKVNDGNGPSGYAVDFMNRGGYIEILKKVKGNTTATWTAGSPSYSTGGTYYVLKRATWSPVSGQTYRFAGQTTDNGNGTTTIRMWIDGQLKLEVIDNGSIGGPRLTGTRVGLRSDFANYTVDNLVISR